MKFNAGLFVMIFYISSLYPVICINVTINVQSFCPDSLEFITTSFKEFFYNPSREQIMENKKIDLVVYGKMNELNRKTNNIEDIELICQHGQDECTANRISNCAQAILNYESSIKFIICLFEDIRNHFRLNLNFKESISNCESNPILSESISKCADGKQALDLIHQAGVKSGIPDHIPLITLGNSWDQDTENKILINMTRFLCEFRQLTNKIKGCQNLDSQLDRRVKNARIQIIRNKLR